MNRTVYYYQTASVWNINNELEERRISVAGVFNDEDKTISIGIAQCSPKDVYIKKKGRTIAEGRAKSKHPASVIQLPEEKAVTAFVQEAKRIIEDL